MVDKVEKGKKRKRNTDGTSKPSKKVALEGDRKVKISLHEADNWAPVIASTPGLTIPTSVSLLPYIKPRKIAAQRPGQTGAIATTELLLHSSAHLKLDYTVQEDESGTLLKHYVGVYDPATGTLEVLEARKMVARASVRSQQATADDNVSTNFRELRNDLGKTFGTKKARKAISSVTENAITPDKSGRTLANGGKPAKLDSAAAAMIATMAEATSAMATQEELTMVADAAKPRPIANLSATKIEDVYSLDSLLGVNVMEYIPVKEWQDAVKSKTEVRVNSRFVANRIAKSGSSVYKLKILRYLLCLLDLFGACKALKGGAKLLPKREELKEALGDMPDLVVQGIKRKYTDGGQLTKFKVDLLITHACALACLVDNYEVDIFDLKEDLKLETKEMSQYFREIGAKIGALPEAMRRAKGLEKAAAAQRKVAKLKLPLEFPKVSFGRK